MLRTTYLSSHQDPLKHAKVDKDGSILLNNLVAAKHIRFRKPLDDSSNLRGSAVSFEFSTTASPLDLPFDPPAGGVGSRVYASKNSDWTEVSEFVKSVASLEVERPVEVDEWQYVLSQQNPNFTIPQFQDADSVRISINPEKNEMISEAWFSEKNWKTVEPVTSEFKTEMGLFQLTKPRDSVYKLDGRVRVLGEKTESSPVMLNWYAKHVSGGENANFNGTLSASLVKPYGLHPTLQYNLTTAVPEAQLCSLYSLVELPSDVFLDQYEVADAPNCGELLGIWGNTDLERAHWDHTQSSAALFKLPADTTNFALPLHFRYANPSESEEQLGSLSSPRVFYNCRNDIAPARDAEFIEPREYLGFESVFPVDTSVFYQFSPQSDEIPYRIPAINPVFESKVGLTTASVVVVQALLLLGVMVYQGAKYLGKETKKKKE